MFLIQWIRQLKIWQKLGAVVVVMAVPMAVMVYLFIQALGPDLSQARSEISGLEYLNQVQSFRTHLQQHHDLVATVIAGDNSQRNRAVALEGVLDADLNVVLSLDQRFGKDYGSTDMVQKLHNLWGAAKDQRNSSERNALASDAQALAQTAELERLIGDKSQLIFDPKQDTYYLVSSMLLEMPDLLNDLSQLRGLTAAAATRGKLSPEETVRVEAMVASAQKNTQALSRDFAVAIAFNPALSNLNQALAGARGTADAYVGRVGGAAIRGSANELIDAGTAAIDGYVKLRDSASKELAAELQKRNSDLMAKGYTQAMIGIFALFLVNLVAWLLLRGITLQVRSITQLFSSVGIGDFDARAKVLAEDELGVMAQSLNSMLDNIVTLIQSQEERDRIQGSIRKLLDEISVVADGDLRAEAEVTAEVTGAIADSFNNMIAELRNIISTVQTTTLAVGSSAGEVQATTEHLASGSENQAMQIVEVSAAIDEMAVSIQQVSENAASASTVAETALESSKRGAESVRKTMEGMTGIRQQVQQTAKRIKRLGESSQEIDEIVRLIGDIADRTSILALNASIQAAMAGEAGKGFAVVAEEVERLADRSTEATKKIATLIKSIQADTNEAIAAMEETTREVVGGSNLANEAGQRLSDIESVSKQLAEIIQSISLASKQQSRGSEAVATSVSDIAQVTQQTAAGAKQAAVSIRRLAELADDLRGSLDRFKLPAHA